MIPDPLTGGRLVIAVDDFTNPKTGRKIFGCSQLFDHAAKTNQSRYPWAQNVVLVGLLKLIKGRWTCLPLAHRFYVPQKAIEAKLENMNVPGKDPLFQTKLGQAVEMLIHLAHHFVGVPITIVCDSLFGNDGLFKPLLNISELQFICSPDYAPLRQCMQCLTTERRKSWADPKITGTDAATIVWIYGTRLENIPERRHKVKGRSSFAFSDLRHIIAKAALTDNLNAV